MKGIRKGLTATGRVGAGLRYYHGYKRTAQANVVRHTGSLAPVTAPRLVKRAE